jgi:hypothetical protein
VTANTNYRIDRVPNWGFAIVVIGVTRKKSQPCHSAGNSDPASHPSGTFRAPIAVEVKVMKSTFAKLVFPIGILATTACGARTPLDGEDDGTFTSNGGAGGSVSTGAGGHGGNVGGGGTKNTGGTVSSGGRPGTGGNINLGGSGGYFTIVGGSGGSSGGTMTGGRSSTGGNAGGAVGSTGGATAPRGGSGGAIIIFLDAGVGGSTGRGDGSPDSRDVGDARPEVTMLVDLLPDRYPATGGAGGSTTCTAPASNEDLIDDLNDGDRFIQKSSGRVGSWSDSHDNVPTGVMYPDPVNPFTPTDTGDPCRKYAAYVKGSGFSDWGANLGFGLGSPYNASKYSGFTFWAKSDMANQSVRVSFPDQDTQPEGALCQANTTGATACHDHYGKYVKPNSTWQKYTVTFKELAQEGWGRQATSFDPSTVYEVLFQIPATADFSLWIDDVAFIK